MKISVLVLTKNESADLPNCLESVKWSDDIHIFDSFSDDNTINIAANFGAHTYQRVFDNYANQRNASLETIKFKYPWVLILDADERIPLGLDKVLRNEIKNASESISAFRIRRRDFLNNKWLKFSQISPYYIRLIKVGKARYF